MVRQTKDSNAPKRPLSSYIIFCQEQREVLKKKNPDMKATELTSKLGDMWNNLSADKKKVYNSKAEKDKERYANQMKDYTPPQKDEEEKEEKGKRKKKEKDPDAPKRKPSGYILFCQDMRSEVKTENPEMTPTQITSRLGELWRELDDDEKSRYNSKSKDSSSSSSSSSTPKASSTSSKRTAKKEEVVEEKPKSRQEKPKRKRKTEEEDLDDE